jgi:rubrerythrin
MVGAIRTRDILAHPFVTIHCFGWLVFFRALIAGRRQTFLSLLAGTSGFRPHAVEVPELLGHCVELESRAQRIYESLASRFTDPEPVGRFFETLARQEQEHHEMLELCRNLASQEGWLEDRFAPWREAVPRLERQMDDVEASLETLDSVADALRLVIQLEGSEINHVFRGAVAATDSEFVRTLRAFQTAEATHITYISDQIPRFEPDLAGECGNLRAAYLGNVIE